MKVSAVIPTRGDVDLSSILESLSWCDEVLVWDNSKRQNLSVYGRYAMIAEARNEVILTQDDDCVISDPTFVVEQWAAVLANTPDYRNGGSFLVANMPSEFLPYYSDSCLVGFGACFHRDLPAQAFERFGRGSSGWCIPGPDWLNRTCDVVFTALTPRVLVDVPKTNLPWATGEERMYRQERHVEERTHVLNLARKVRDV